LPARRTLVGLRDAGEQMATIRSEGGAVLTPLST
jgi:hypothetical protein